MQPDPISQTWFIISNRLLPDERITIASGQEKYALVFSQKATAKEFMRDLQDPDLELEALETWVLKETYLTTLTLLSVSRVMFDYVQGQHNALSAPLELLRIHCQAQIRVVPRAVSA